MPKRLLFLAPLFVILSVAAVAAVAVPVRAYLGPNVRDVVEFEGIIQPADEDNDLLNDQVSPDGRQAFIVTRKAEVASDKNVYKILMLDVTPTRLVAHRAPDPVTIFSAAIAHDNDFASPGIQDVQWCGERSLVFLARLDGEAFQVYRLDVLKRELLQLTHEKNRIVAWATSQDMQRVVYTVQLPNPPMQKGDHGIVVGTQSFWNVNYGQHDLTVQPRKYQNFLVDLASQQPSRAIGPPFMPTAATVPTVSISPDGRWALLPRYEPERLAAWTRQYPMIDELQQKFGWSKRVDPLQYFSTLAAVSPRRMVAVRLADGKEQAIVDAPDDLYFPSFGKREDRLWQGTGTSVVLAGTHLPKAGNGKTPLASHAIEYWPDSGRWADIAELKGRLQAAHRLADGFWLVDDSGRREFHRRVDGAWRESGENTERAGLAAGWGLSVTQGLNLPPDVYAKLPGGSTTRLTQLNPQFNVDTWGSMKPYTWIDKVGRPWKGGLMAANDIDSHVRHPLVIQTYGFSPDRFYIDGPNLSDGAFSGFAGRAFLREGILVLAMPWNPEHGSAPEGHQAIDVFNEGVRAAVDSLASKGMVDPARVGIIGWSATGERVLNLLAFGDVPIQAATMADGDTNTLFSIPVLYGYFDRMWERIEKFNEGMPFGDSLANWVRNDPNLHTDCIHAALRIEGYGNVVKTNWDTYALLRRQQKAVEMIVVPDDSHSLLVPGDRMLSLQGNVDWHGFWLAGGMRTTPELRSETAESLAQQYARWQQMAMLKDVDDARPRCPH